MSTGLTPVHRRNAHGGPQPVFSALAALLLAAVLIALLVDRLTSGSTPVGTGSGVAATQARSVPPFTGVELAGANNVVIHVGARQSVVVHADSNLLGRVTTRVRSGSLVIGTTPGTLNAKSPMFVAVSVPALQDLTLDGAGNISVTGVTGANLAVELPGSGTINAAGTVTRLDVTVSGSGTALLGQLIAADVKAALSGDGTINLTATHSLSASLSGSGAITYTGSPAQVTKTVTGSGTISGG